MSKFFASLCLGDGGGYVTIHAKDRDEARTKMFESQYGKRWAFLYDESEFQDALGQYGQEEVAVIGQPEEVHG